MSCAACELEEEIRYRANMLIPIASYFASVGNSNERMYLFLALDLEKQSDVWKPMKESGKWLYRSTRGVDGVN
jgi:hypothetical protein